MTVTKLDLYNQVLGALGERSLASLSENREPRRLLDGAWNRGAVDFCLGQAPWTFALRASQLDHDPSITPDFGYIYSFAIPDDCVQPWSVCSEEYFRYPLTRFVNESGYIYADITPVYIRYVSNDPAYGGDMSKWGRQFQAYVAAYLANEIALKLTQSENKANAAERRMAKAEKEAKGSDAVASPPVFFPPGRMVLSRSGGSVRYQDMRR